MVGCVHSGGRQQALQGPSREARERHPNDMDKRVIKRVIKLCIPRVFLGFISFLVLSRACALLHI